MLPPAYEQLSDQANTEMVNYLHKSRSSPSSPKRRRECSEVRHKFSLIAGAI